MSAIDQVKGHFSKLAVKTIEVPEWADESGAPLIIYSRPLTLAEKSKIVAVGDRDGRIAMLAHALVLKAETAQGEKLFTIEHKHALMNSADPDVVARVVTEIMMVSSIEESEKN